MQRSGISTLIGAVFGLVYILVNAGKLPDTPAIILRIAAILVFVAVYLAIRHLPADDDEPSASRFDRRYWTVVATELIAGLVGVAVVAGPLHHEEASVAWISLVVGVHFVELARIWAHPRLTVLGGAIAACGVLGLVLAFAHGTDEAVAVTGGILPGTVLLLASWLAALGLRRAVTGLS
ncbi:MAG TPA: hypothetical protein VHO01_10045 [Jatrophihabitans sp.]|nr:hypothetical protein [Jatrophihabitans sp.]